MRRIQIYILLVFLIAGCADSFNGELIYVKPDPGDAFHYPYFLYLPEQVVQNQETFIVVEPNNSGFVDDDLQKHIDKAKRTATRSFYLGNYVAQNLKISLLVPVFPRRKSEWKIYTHALDRDAIIQKDNTLARIDNQLIEMFTDARLKLEEKNIPTREQFLLTGFSASGTFANRFTLMHPDKVFAVAAGGLNGLLMLPTDSLKGLDLKYPLGTSDFKDLFNEDFQMNLFMKTPQFYFMGELDDNDAVPYDDAFDSEEREIIYQLVGEEMLPRRWNYCGEIYSDNGVNVKLKTYKETGHDQTEKVKEEVTNYFKGIINNQ